MKNTLLTLSILFFAAISLFPQETKKINLKDYAGVYSYQKEDLPQASVLLEGEKLFLTLENISRAELIYKSGDKFDLKEPGYSIEFIRNKEGVVEKILIARPEKSTIEGIKKSEKSLSEYVGEYYRSDKDDPSHLFITLENNKLFGEADGGKFEFSPIKGDDFEIKEVSFGVIFTRNNLGKVDGIRLIRADGSEMIGKKVEKK